MKPLGWRVDPLALARGGLAVAAAVGGVILALTTIVVIATAQASHFDSSYKVGPEYAYTDDVISYTIVAVNAGELVTDVLLSDPVPNGAEFVVGSCTYRRPGGRPANCDPPPDLWQEDFFPGDRITTTFACRVTKGTMNWPLINRAYLNWDRVQLASFTKEVSWTTMVNPRFQCYLPVVMCDYPPMPDLRVALLMVEPSSPAAGQLVTITVAIQNAGGAAAEPFWVDLYDNPDPPPTRANQPFDVLCSGAPEDCYGIAWYVSGGLDAGESVMLTSLTGYVEEYSRWPGSFVDAGPHAMYAFADSWNDPVWYGSVLERNEGIDNRYGPVSADVTTGAGRRAIERDIWLPRRPIRP
jgi:uncharacterized repeat protein (TIGR01451 family)